MSNDHAQTDGNLIFYQDHVQVGGEVGSMSTARCASVFFSVLSTNGVVENTFARPTWSQSGNINGCIKGTAMGSNSISFGNSFSTNVSAGSGYTVQVSLYSGPNGTTSVATQSFTYKSNGNVAASSITMM